MSQVFIVANLKSYKIESEAKKWLEEFLEIKSYESKFENKKIIICPSFTLLPLFSSFVKENSLLVELGAQNVSPFDEGAYTGEVNARQLKDYCNYVLVGHSERRNNFNETEQLLGKKTELALKYQLMPIFCIQNNNNDIPQGVNIVAYEPTFAIGSGNPDTPENADLISSSVNSKENKYNILYGGSVNSGNVGSFTKMPNISGVLIGGESLNAKEFIEIIKNA